MIKRIGLFSVFVILLSVSVYSVPAYINYQGVLRDNSGTALTGTYSINFKIYAADTGGTALWESGAQSVTASNGLYTVKLGPITTPTTTFDGSRRWLEVVVGTDTLSPRMEITSVAYAIRTDYATTAESATTAATVSDNAITSAKILNGAVTGGKLAGDIIINTSGNITTTGTLTINKLTTGGTGNGFCVGRALLPAAGDTVTVTNTNISSNSIILTSIATTENFGFNEVLQVKNVISNQFTVVPMDADTTKDIWFNYLVIN